MSVPVLPGQATGACEASLPDGRLLVFDGQHWHVEAGNRFRIVREDVRDDVYCVIAAGLIVQAGGGA